MTKLPAFALPTALLMLAACSGPAQQPDPSTEANEFAARINGGKKPPAPSGTVAPTVAQPLENAADGPFVAGTATDPDSKTCRANEMGQFIGLEASDNVQGAILTVLDGSNEVRFVTSGGDYVRPDPTNPRLNIMLDGANIIRDARCG